MSDCKRRAKDVHRLTRTLHEVTDYQAKVVDVDWEHGLQSVSIQIETKYGMYAGLPIKFRLNIGDPYPEKPPGVECLREDFLHPNIDTDYICISIFDTWRRCNDLIDVVQGLLFLLHEPNFDDPLIGEATEERVCSYVKNCTSKVVNIQALGNPTDVSEAASDTSCAVDSQTTHKNVVLEPETHTKDSSVTMTDPSTAPEEGASEKISLVDSEPATVSCENKNDSKTESLGTGMYGESHARESRYEPLRTDVDLIRSILSKTKDVMIGQKRSLASEELLSKRSDDESDDESEEERRKCFVSDPPTKLRRLVTAIILQIPTQRLPVDEKELDEYYHRSNEEMEKACELNVDPGQLKRTKTICNHSHLKRKATFELKDWVAEQRKPKTSLP